MEKCASQAGTERLQPTEAGVKRAADLLRGGGIVAMPTETVYGLAANALDAAAVERIFQAKERPHWDPLIVHVSDATMLARVAAGVSDEAQRLMQVFWPGPLTLLLPRGAAVPDAVTAGRELVGVRMPAHPLALELLRAADLPLAAPSANRFGHVSPTTAEHVLADLDGRIDAVLDGGPCSVGVESTVFDPAAGVIYRQGGVSQGALEETLGRSVTVYVSELTDAEPQSLPSPGVGIRHYAPRARVLLVEDEAAMRERLADFSGPDAGVMLPQGWAVPGFRGAVFAWERMDDPAALARTLYTGLRELDARGVEAIICPLPAEGQMGDAVRDRLRKAAKV